MQKHSLNKIREELGFRGETGVRGGDQLISLIDKSKKIQIKFIYLKKKKSKSSREVLGSR